MGSKEACPGYGAGMWFGNWLFGLWLMVSFEDDIVYVGGDEVEPGYEVETDCNWLRMRYFEWVFYSTGLNCWLCKPLPTQENLRNTGVKLLADLTPILKNLFVNMVPKYISEKILSRQPAVCNCSDDEEVKGMRDFRAVYQTFLGNCWRYDTAYLAHKSFLFVIKN